MHSLHQRTCLSLLLQRLHQAVNSTLQMAEGGLMAPVDLLGLDGRGAFASIQYTTPVQRRLSSVPWMSRYMNVTHPCEGHQLVPLPWLKVCSHSAALLLPAPAWKVSQPL